MPYTSSQPVRDVDSRKNKPDEAPEQKQALPATIALIKLLERLPPSQEDVKLTVWPITEETVFEFLARMREHHIEVTQKADKLILKGALETIKQQLLGDQAADMLSNQHHLTHIAIETQDNTHSSPLFHALKFTVANETGEVFSASHSSLNSAFENSYSGKLSLQDLRSETELSEFVQKTGALTQEKPLFLQSGSQTFPSTGQKLGIDPLFSSILIKPTPVTTTPPPVNYAPTLSTAFSDSIINNGTGFNLSAASYFTDQNGNNTLTYQARLSGGGALPAWLSFNSSTGVFSGTPSLLDAGTITIEIIATDNTNQSVSDQFILDVNSIPAATTISGQLFTVGYANLFDAGTYFTDADGDTLTYSITMNGGGSLPSWLVFNAATGEFTGSPAIGDIGDYDIDITASDGRGGSRTLTFTLSAYNYLTVGTSGADNLTGTSIYGREGNDTLNGTAGNDVLNGAADNDTIFAGSGDDILYGDTGDDFVLGDGGDDLVYGEDGQDTLYGWTGNDTMYGGAGADLLSGEDDNDSLYGEAGADTLYGWSGSDLIQGGDDNDIAYGGNDDDTISGGNGNDYLLGDWGNDQVSGDDGADTIYGSDGNDTLNGGDGNDYISGENDDDIIYGGTGLDSLYGGLGNDTIYGGDDNDAIEGNQSNDVLYGEAGADTILGGAGYDTIYGGDNQDSLSGGDDNDSLYGGNGNDYLEGNNAADSLLGEAGADTLLGGSGFDTLSGGTGNDSLYGGDDDDTLYGGDDNDYLEGNDGADSLYGEASSDTLLGGAGYDTLQGGDGNDSLYGNDADDTLYGGNGDDYLEGNDAADILYGDAGNDTLLGGAGFDSLNGGDGNDSINSGTQNDTVIASLGNDTVNGDADTDTIDYRSMAQGGTINIATGSAIFGSKTDSFSNFEIVIGSFYTDSMTGSTNAELIDGSDGNDTIMASLGNDTIDGGNDIDVVNYSSMTQGGTINLATGSIIYGTKVDSISNVEYVIASAYADSITGSNVANAISGGAGNDTIIASLGNDTIDGGADTDILDYRTMTQGGTINIATGSAIFGSKTDGFSNFEIIIGSGYADAITGSANAESIDGSDGNDTITGNGGNDTIDGGNNNDSITSGSGNDSITGNNGNDTIIGSLGNDTLNGGTNTDSLYYTSLNADAYIDFTTNTASFTSLGKTDSITQFELIYTGSGNDTVIGGAESGLFNTGAGNDSISAGGGDDTISAGSGNDTIDGGTGTDLVGYSSYTTAGNINLATGIVYFAALNETDTLSNVENINSGSGNDTITGGTEDNIFVGNGGHDSMNGGGGNDSLDGGAQNDTLIGGAGSDSLTGGSGNDSFVIDDSASIDHITDMKTSGTDTIRLEDDVFTFATGDGSKAGIVLTASDIFSMAGFGGGSFASGSGATLLYDTSNGFLWYDADSNSGGGTAVYFATIDNYGSYTFSASDFYGY